MSLEETILKLCTALELHAKALNNVLSGISTEPAKAKPAAKTKAAAKTKKVEPTPEAAPTPEPAEEPEPEAEAEAEAELTLDTMREAIKDLPVIARKKAIALVKATGNQKISDVPEDQWPDLMASIQALA